MTSREERFAAHDLSRVTATSTTTLSSLSSSSSNSHHHQLQQQQHLHHHQHYTTLSHDELRITATSATTATQQHHHGVVGHLAAAAVAAEDFSALLPPLGLAAPDMDQQILELIQKQEQQKQRLFHSYQEKTKQLELEHKMQLEHKYQELREQRLATTVEEQQQRERRDREVIKRKENCSANASPEVKQILNYFLKSKQAASSNGMATSSRYRNGGIVKSSSGESLPAGSVSSAHPYKIPQPPPPFLKYESDFPLRKTASEPNLLKIRLKQSVIERKARICGPAGARRHERILSAAQRRQQKHNTAAATAACVAAVALTNSNSTPDSGPNSPPSSTLSSVVGSRGSPTSAPIQEENEEGSQYQPGQRSSINDLSLFSSPSMPNISLGRPHLSNAHAHTNFALLATLRQHVQHGGGSGGAAASASAAVGGPPAAYYPLAAVYGGRHLPTSMLPPVGAAVGGSAAVPPLPSPVVRSASGTSTSSSQASLVGDCHTPPQCMGGAPTVGAAPPPPAAHAASSISSLMGQATAGGPSALGPGSVIHATGSPAGSSVYGQPITDVQVAHAHLNKQGHRPLGRTQSAPLPLGHPMLTGTGSNQIQIGQTHYENISETERQHMLLNQKIRQTVLTRSGAVREPQLKEEDDSAEVIDLTDKQKPPKTVLTSTVMTSTAQMLPEASAPTGRHPPPPPLTTTALACHGLKSKSRDQEYLQQQRELLYQQSLQVDPEAMMRGGYIRTLSRTLSSPLVHMGPHIADTGQHGLPHHISPIVTSSSADHIPPSAVNLTVPHAKRQLILDYSSSSSSCTSSATVGSVQYPPTPSASSASAVSAGSASGSSLNLRITAVPSHKLTTGLAYDNVMLKHTCICGNNGLHPEHSGRLQSVWARLNETDLAKRCDRLHSRKATQEELQSVHTEAHSLLFGSSPGQLNRQKLENIPSASFVRLSCGGVGVDLDTTWNEQHTAAAARMAAGCVIDLAFKTAKGDIKNGFAVVRPPGHHAEANLAMGFCFFNSIAVAAKLLRQRMPEMRRILIVDWDVHHGNGTQQAFYENPDVLYLSIHRHDDGNFFPGTGGPTECGSGPGLGYNVNISWSGGLDPPLGDAEYIAAFRTIVMPIAKSFNPDIVLVSSGFDAAAGHSAPLGGYLVSPACFGYMTRELMQLANGRVVLALEGGYDLPAICDSAQECVRALLGDPLSAIAERELKREPCRNAIDTLQKTIAIQLQHWPCVSQLAHTVAMPAIATLKTEHDESDTVTAMAGLSMHPLRTLSREDSEEPMDQDEAK